MSKIQDALNRLRNDAGTAESPPKSRLRNRIDAEVPVARTPAANSASPTTGKIHSVDLRRQIELGLLPPPQSRQSVADEFRRIKRPLIKNAFSPDANDEYHRNVLLITSALPKAGKSFCSVNLAISVAMERELNVLLVDADVAKPHITRAFGLADEPGLIDLLGDEPPSIESTLVRTDLYGIQVLPAGRVDPHTTELLASARMSAVLDELARRYSDRLIIIDSPPLLVTTEAQAIASQVGQIALIVEYGVTNQYTIEEVMDVLDMSRPINVIFNKSVDLPVSGFYGAGYGYYFDADADADRID